MRDAMMDIKVSKYGTTMTYCGCPDYQYRQAKAGGQCKHMRYLIQCDSESQKMVMAVKKFNPDDFRGDGMDLNEAGEKYSDEVLQKWAKAGEIFLDKNKWRLLE